MGFISHRRNGIQINGSALKNDSKYQVQELLGYVTVNCAQQSQQFYCVLHDSLYV